jgi:hypothetical protein
MVAGSLTRLSYALGALLAPDTMSALRLAPDIRGHAAGRMDFRAFGGLHINIALLTLRAACLNRDPEIALGLNIGCELSDLATTLLEWRDRGGPDRLLLGSVAVAAAGLATWTTALRNL